MSSDESDKPVNVYSKAFQNMMTEGPDDIVGLLAYALFKQNIHEEAKQGIKNDGTRRNPSTVTVNLYRTSATSRLNDFGAKMIDDARAEIQESAVLERLRTAEAGLRSHVSASTRTGRAIWTNLVAWVVTAVLTIVIIFSLALSNLQERVTNLFVDGAVEAVRPTAEPEPAQEVSPPE